MADRQQTIAASVLDIAHSIELKFVGLLLVIFLSDAKVVW